MLWVLASSLIVGCRRVGGEITAVEVLYAGSLVSVMERAVRPAFTEGTTWDFRGEAMGSRAAARFVADGVRHPDVYVTADTATFALLGGEWPGWAVLFAGGELALAYDARGRFAASLDSAARGDLPWYDVLLRPGFRFGRTDPELDPKGYRTLWMFELAARHYGDPTLARRLEAASDSRRHVFPEPHLAARVQMGQLDAGAFYLAEARSYDLRPIRLPPHIHLGSQDLAGLYAKLRYRTSHGEELRGSPIVYAATIPRGARNREGALDFLRLLLGPDGSHLLAKEGLPAVHAFVGDRTRLPARLEGILEREAPEADRGP